MGRTACCSRFGLRRGPWTPREDTLLVNYIQLHGEGHWRIVPKKAGLLRCGKSCRLRWMNYLRPDIKRGNITADEDDLIIRLHSLLGNRWSLIAGRLPDGNKVDDDDDDDDDDYDYDYVVNNNKMTITRSYAPSEPSGLVDRQMFIVTCLPLRIGEKIILPQPLPRSAGVSSSSSSSSISLISSTSVVSMTSES
ncbi:hypothetical protein G4B88_006514 [Cannabis sativa]|uniref:Uncharacterized protein n=1 Tax=Cannabis sativa TaxID=3483 RepID=A0A7J6H2W6_CANSA|nr:hypothetical protein G4B88_006514 [Cannabis sativa]